MRPQPGAELLLPLFRQNIKAAGDRTSRAIRRGFAPRNSALQRPIVTKSFSEPASPYSRRPQVRSWRQERFQVPPCSFSVALHGVASSLAQYADSLAVFSTPRLALTMLRPEAAGHGPREQNRNFHW